MNPKFPAGAGEFLEIGKGFRARLESIKKELTIPDYGWYPYEPLTALPVIAELIGPVYEEIASASGSGAVLDIGCADGDLAMFFAHLGADVDAVDHRESNYNQMRGVDALGRALGLTVHAYDIDLDARFDLPRANYGLALFLGTLYHLKNPFYVLEKLAAVADWCMVSTRVAQVTPGARARIEAEPVAYLLGPREINDDPTNFWIFSAVGLTRVLERAGWIPVGAKRIGCAVDSDPVNPAADERMFVLAKSRTRHPELDVRPLDGWYAVENDAWRWTAKRFALQVTLPESGRASEFALRFTVPEVVLAGGGKVRLACWIGGEHAGTISCEAAETIEFRGRFPANVPRGSAVRLDFSVDGAFEGSAADRRELGVIVPLLDSSQRNTARIPFRIS